MIKSKIINRSKENQLLKGEEKCTKTVLKDFLI